MRKWFFLFLLINIALLTAAQPKKAFCITGYFSGKAAYLDSFPVGKLTHIIFSFGHLNGNKFFISNAGDSACIQKMVSLKAKYPQLKVILSMGGWGGCKDCSVIYSTEIGRTEFAKSVREVT